MDANKHSYGGGGAMCALLGDSKEYFGKFKSQEATCMLLNQKYVDSVRKYMWKLLGRDWCLSKRVRV